MAWQAEAPPLDGKGGEFTKHVLFYVLHQVI